MAPSTHSLLAVAAGLLSGACGPEHEVGPLSAFQSYTLAAGTQALVRDGGEVDPNNFKVTLVLQRPSWDWSVSPECLAIAPEVMATLDGQTMKSHASGTGRALGSCTEPVFTLIVPRDRYGMGESRARFQLRDATHTMRAEFEDFYLPGGGGRSLPVLSCEGVAECTASGAR